MAYDEHRTFARPALQSVVHVEHDSRRMYGRGQSVGFQYTSQAPFGHDGLVSSLSYAPAVPIHMAGPSRRPLPTPRTRPESMPPPLRQSPLVVQAPAPSRPAILAPSATLATSPTAPPARRPLPTPALPPTKHASVDLSARPASPAKAIINTIIPNPNPDRDLRIPSSFSRRTAPPPDTTNRPPPAPFTPLPTWPRAPRSETHESKSPPLRNRNFHPASSATIGANVIERRSTVSGVFPPTVPPPRADPRRAESPERTQPAQRLQSSPPRRPLPSSPTSPPRVPSFHQRVPASSEDEYDISSPSDISSLSDQDAYEPMTFADPLQTEDDEHDIVFASPSPQYGIRDLPTRSRMAIANRDDSQNPKAIVPSVQQEQATRTRSATLPEPPSPNSSTPQGHSQATSLPQSPRASMSPPASGSFTPFSEHSSVPGTPAPETQSLTLRLASMSLAEERERDRKRQPQQEISSPKPAQSPIRATPAPASPVRQQQGWHANVPLPRTPRHFFGTADVSSEFAMPNTHINDVSYMPFYSSRTEHAIQKWNIFTISSIVTNQPNTPTAPLPVISESKCHV